MLSTTRSRAQIKRVKFIHSCKRKKDSLLFLKVFDIVKFGQPHFPPWSGFADIVSEY